MANLTANIAKSATNDGVTVDTITFTPTTDGVTVLNRSTSATLWVRVNSAADPTVAGDDCYGVPPGAVLTVDMSTNNSAVVKVLGDASCPYTVAES